MQYANLAVRGRLLQPIVDDQVPQALALDPPPTLMTFNGGGNDLMRPALDPQQLLASTERAVRQVTDAGVRLVLLSGADPTARLPFGRTVHRRGVALTAGLAELATRFGVPFVDAFGDSELRRAGDWSPDRLHLGPAGHRRVASLVLTALGYDVPPHEPDAGSCEARRVPAEVRYYREHVLPWVARRLRGRSSGDGRLGKHVGWVAVSAPEPRAPAASRRTQQR